jgi:hypothetical protein
VRARVRGGGGKGRGERGRGGGSEGEEVCTRGERRAVMRRAKRVGAEKSEQEGGGPLRTYLGMQSHTPPAYKHP